MSKDSCWQKPLIVHSILHDLPHGSTDCKGILDDFAHASTVLWRGSWSKTSKWSNGGKMDAHGVKNVQTFQHLLVGLLSHSDDLKRPQNGIWVQGPDDGQTKVQFLFVAPLHSFPWATKGMSDTSSSWSAFFLKTKYAWWTWVPKS